jgi:hypothetical protein
MDLQTAGKMLLVLGAAILLTGLLFIVGGRLGLGSLPGDLRFQGEGWGCFVPIASMLLISLVLTLVVNVIWRLFR